MTASVGMSSRSDHEISAFIHKIGIGILRELGLFRYLAISFVISLQVQFRSAALTTEDITTNGTASLRFVFVMYAEISSTLDQVLSSNHVMSQSTSNIIYWC